jgi:hypothetical protein
VKEETTVLDYLEEAKGKPPPILTVERSAQSTYPFHLLVRHTTHRLGLKPQFIQHERQKNFEDQIRGAIEEHSLFNHYAGHYGAKSLFVLEGFPPTFATSLNPPEGTYVVAETTGGWLKAEPFTQSKKRDILKILLQLLKLDLSLRGLLKLDWSGLRAYEEFEPILRKARLMQWDEERIGEELKGSERGNLLAQLKRADHRPIAETIDRAGTTWTHNRLLQATADLIHYRSLRAMGFDEARSAKEVGADSWSKRARDLEEAAKMYTAEDLQLMAERIVRMDRLVTTSKGLGLQLLILNAPVRVRR